MSTDGILEYQGTKRVLFRGDTSNIVFDTRTTSLGIGVTGSNNPSSNLYITGNAYVSSNLAIGGVMTMGVVNVAARHNLQAVTDMGNVTTHTVEFTNPTTSIVTSGNVSVGKDLTVSGNVEVGTANLFTDTVNSRVGVGTSNPTCTLDVRGPIATPGYHAQWTLSCAGLVKWNGTRLSWTHRVVAVPVEKNEFAGSGHFDIDVPSSGTSITYYDGGTNTQTTVTTNSAGFPLNPWEALWYVVTPGEGAGTDNSNYVITEYRNSNWKPNSNWLLIAFVNGDSTYQEHLKFIPTSGTFYIWKALPFVYSWVNYDSVYTPGGYYRDNNGIVHLRGLIKSGTDDRICTLPAGYRPGYRILINGHTNYTGACRVDIKTDGLVTLEHATYSSTWVCLDGIHFKAEQ